VAGLRAGDKLTYVVKRGCGPTTEDGVYANQRLNLADDGKADGRKAKVPNRTREIRPSGIIGGPRKTWSWWNWDPTSQSKERDW